MLLSQEMASQGRGKRTSQETQNDSINYRKDSPMHCIGDLYLFVFSLT